ncbi:MAG: hypothetical protein N2C14_00735, partial [Planctomycetales bacterium]
FLQPIRVDQFGRVVAWMLGNVGEKLVMAHVLNLTPCVSSSSSRWLGESRRRGKSSRQAIKRFRVVESLAFFAFRGQDIRSPPNPIERFVAHSP